MRLVALNFACLLAIAFMTACTTLVAAYDPVFDQSLNKMSEDTAKFLAAAGAGSQQRRFSSTESTEFYAVSYNVLDRLIERARHTRGPIACPVSEALTQPAAAASSETILPQDYTRFDCREFQLYSIRLSLDQLRYFHRKDGTLNVSEVDSVGLALQKSIIGSIKTFTVNKPG
jgi:hypothetical protein